MSMSTRSGWCSTARLDVGGDQPRPVDPRDLVICPDDPYDLLRLGVDVVALEIQRASVAVDRDPEVFRWRGRRPSGSLGSGQGVPVPHDHRTAETTNASDGLRRMRPEGHVPQAHELVDPLTLEFS
jgi:hypothetical protein